MYVKILTVILIYLGVMTPVAVAEVKTTATKQSTIKVKKITLEGNTVFDDSELETFISGLEGKEISYSQIFELRQKLTKYYLDRGYLSSGAFLPPQKLTDGEINIQILEGTLVRVDIEGLKGLSENYIKSRLPQEKKPLNFQSLTKYLERLQRDPLIKNLTAEILQPTVGENLLLVEVEEADPLKSQLAFTNAFSPSIGSFGGIASITHQNLLGFGDRLNLNRSQTDGLTRFGGYYSFPFNPLDGRIVFEYNNANSELIEEEVEELDIQADYEAFALNLKQPIISNKNETLILGAAFEYINSETFVLEDFSFPLTEGLEDGQSKIAALRFTQDYVSISSNSSFVLSSQFSLGLDALDATKTDLGIDGIFWRWRGDFQYLLALNDEEDVVLGTKITAQMTPDRLLPQEQITLGGLGKVRGYRPNLGVADNGVIGSIELRLPLIRGDDWGLIQIIPFFDVGTLWNNSRDIVGSNTYASSGVTLRYQLREAIDIRFDLAFPIIEAGGFGATDTEDNFSLSILVNPFRF